jgi:hypothetical protein
MVANDGVEEGKPRFLKSAVQNNTPSPFKKQSQDWNLCVVFDTLGGPDSGYASPHIPQQL